MGSIDLPELTEIIKNLEEILENQKALAEQLNSMKGDSLPTWIGLKEACALKGVAYSTIQKPENRYLMPPLSERQRVGKALKWPRDVILKWLLQNDQELEEVKNRLRKVQTINATLKPPTDAELERSAPIYDQVEKALKLIDEIQNQSQQVWPKL